MFCSHGYELLDHEKRSVLYNSEFTFKKQFVVLIFNFGIKSYADFFQIFFIFHLNFLLF